jgi:hypothetical protein
MGSHVSANPTPHIITTTTTSSPEVFAVMQLALRH